MTLPNPFETFEPFTEPPRPGLDAQLENAVAAALADELAAIHDVKDLREILFRLEAAQ